MHHALCIRLQYTENDGLKKSSLIGGNGVQKKFMESTFNKPVESLDDLLKILGAADDGDWQIFKDSKENLINTINIGSFKKLN